MIMESRFSCIHLISSSARLFPRISLIFSPLIIYVIVIINQPAFPANTSIQRLEFKYIEINQDEGIKAKNILAECVILHFLNTNAQK